MIYRWLGGALIVAVLVSGAFAKGCSYGKSIVQAELDAQRIVWQAEHDKQVAETKRVQDEWNRIIGERDGLQAELHDAAARGATLAARLRDYRSRQCAVPRPAPTPTGAVEAAPESSLDERIGAVTERVFGACAAEAKQLAEVLSRYEAVRAAQ